MRGGLREGELCVFLAIAKGGKTMVLSNLGVGLLSMGYRVIHYTLEMSEVDVLKRYLSVLTGVPTNELQQHYPSVRQAVAALDAYTEGNVIIKYFPGKATTLEQLEGHLNLCEADNDGHPLIPIVDYADRLTIPARMEEWRALEEIYTHIRSLAEQHKIPIITASQANTGGYTASQLGPQHISGTTRKGFVLDYLWSVDTSPLDADIGRLRLTCLLNRHDRPHTATYWRADYTSGRIEPISHQDYELMETLHAGDEHAQHAQT
jgi:archaellum biogenesis ATPase FlaH